jgi:hypothetical protein
MDDLFKRIETGQYIAYFVRFHGPARLDTLFSSKEDALMYGRVIIAWWNSYYPSCCVAGLPTFSVVRELVV